MTKKHLGIAVAVVVAVVLVGYAVWRVHDSGFSWAKFAASFYHVDWSWLALALSLVLATYVGRALRWEVMIRPLRKDASLWRLFTATAIGFTAVVLFGRAGEPVRPYLIAKREGVPFSSQMAAWVVERILDLLMVLLIFGIALTQVQHSAIEPGPKTKAILQTGGYLVGLLGAVFLAILIGLRQFRAGMHQRLLRLLSFLPQRVLPKIQGILGSFEEGMESMRSAWSVFLLAAYTVIEWSVIAAAYFCFFRAFPATSGFSLADVVIVLGFVAFGSAVQIPGVGGGMQVVAVLVLTELFGLGLSAATGIAVVLWIISFVTIVPLGLALAFHEGIKWRSLKHLEPTS